MTHEINKQRVSRFVREKTSLMTHEINKPSKAIYWIAGDGNGNYVTGKTKPNQVTTSGALIFETFLDEADYLERLAILSITLEDGAE